jgi:uncharacterized protein YjbI with pentapeptide repeats
MEAKMSEMRQLLDRALALHYQWRESKGKEGEQLDFSGADLENANFRLASFNGSDMFGCYICEANLENAKFCNSFFKGADFLKVDLTEIPLLEARIRELAESRKLYARKEERRLRRRKSVLRLVTSGGEDGSGDK